MPRKTGTRIRVRELAEQLHRGGTEPTVRLLRDLLGGGSPNTIVDELRRWRTEAAPRTLPSAVVAAPAAPAKTQPQMEDATPELPARLGALERRVAELGDSLRQFLEAISRLDDTHQRAMLLVDEARARGRYWEEEARRLRTENREKEEHYRQAMYRALDECNVLRGRLAEARSFSSRASGDTASSSERLLTERPDVPKQTPVSLPRTSAYDPDGRSQE